MNAIRGERGDDDLSRRSAGQITPYAGARPDANEAARPPTQQTAVAAAHSEEGYPTTEYRASVLKA